MVLFQKSLDYAHGIDRTAELKNKKKQEKILKMKDFMGQFVNLYLVENSNVLISFQGLFALLSYDIRQKKP